MERLPIRCTVGGQSTRTPRLLRMRRLHHIRAPGGVSGHQQATNLLAVGEFAIIGAELLLREGTIAAAPVIRPLRLPPSAGTTSHRLQLRIARNRSSSAARTVPSPGMRTPSTATRRQRPSAIRTSAACESHSHPRPQDQGDLEQLAGVRGVMHHYNDRAVVLPRELPVGIAPIATMQVQCSLRRQGVSVRFPQG